MLAVPRKACHVWSIVRRTGEAPVGFAGGRVFRNREGRLPEGRSYREYDIDARQQGELRTAERLVVDAHAGRAWYSPDHYDSFTELDAEEEAHDED